MKTLIQESIKSILEDIEKYLPSWGGYQVIETTGKDNNYYDTIIEIECWHTDSLKIRTTSTDMKHSMEQARNLLKLWCYKEGNWY